jgi:hypothetical protein
VLPRIVGGEQRGARRQVGVRRVPASQRRQQGRALAVRLRQHVAARAALGGVHGLVVPLQRRLHPALVAQQPAQPAERARGARMSAVRPVEHERLLEAPGRHVPPLRLPREQAHVLERAGAGQGLPALRRRLLHFRPPALRAPAEPEGGAAGQAKAHPEVVVGRRAGQDALHHAQGLGVAALSQREVGFSQCAHDAAWRIRAVEGARRKGHPVLLRGKKLVCGVMPARQQRPAGALRECGECIRTYTFRMPGVTQTRASQAREARRRGRAFG